MAKRYGYKIVETVTTPHGKGTKTEERIIYVMNGRQRDRIRHFASNSGLTELDDGMSFAFAIILNAGLNNLLGK